MIEKIVSVSVIGQALMLTPRRVQQLADLGIIPKAERGKHPFMECARGYIEYLRRAIQGNTATEDARLKSAQADLRELEYTQKRSQLLERSLVETVIADLLVMMNRQIDAVSGGLAMELAGETNPEVIRSRLRSEAREIRQGVADGFGRLISDIEKRAGQDSG